MNKLELINRCYKLAGSYVSTKNPVTRDIIRKYIFLAAFYIYEKESYREWFLTNLNKIMKNGI